MANYLESYLVGLSFSVDKNAYRAFNDTLRNMAATVEKYTISPFSGIGGMFLKAGGIITGAIAAVDIATIGLLRNVANTDLQMQIMARRSFMATSAFRQLSIATDALGVSLEDIIVGPPELRQRYAQLMEDQKRMAPGLDWEKQMMQIRTFEFQFTRMHVAAQYFMMYLAGSVSKALFGDKGSLLANLQSFNESFTPEKLQYYADKVANVLVPALNATWKVLKAILSVAEYLEGHKKLLQALGFSFAGGVAGMATGAVVGSVVPGLGTMGGAVIGGAIGALGGGVVGAGYDIAQWDAENRAGGRTAQDWKLYAQHLATTYGLDRQKFMNLIQTESGWDPTAENPKTHAYGFGQIMPKNMHMYGMDATDPQQNLEMSARYLSELLKKNSGDWNAALKEYGGFVTQDPTAYQNKILGPHPASYSGGASPVNVHIMHANANAEEIKRAVMEAIDQRDRMQNQRLAIEFGAAYA